MQFIGPELIAGVDVVPDGNHLPDVAPHNAYPAAGDDSWVAIAVASDDQWAKLAGMIGGEYWREMCASAVLARARPMRRTWTG